jgi:hypothetical protein
MKVSGILDLGIDLPTFFFQINLTLSLSINILRVIRVREHQYGEKLRTYGLTFFSDSTLGKARIYNKVRSDVDHSLKDRQG